MKPSFEVDTKAFWRDGYLVIRNVFTEAEIADIKERVHRSEEMCKSQNVARPGDVLSNPYLADLVIDERIVSIAQAILGGPPAYFWDSSYTVARMTKKGTGTLHKDNVDRHDPGAPDWQGGRYNIIRFGLYLQQHSVRAGGLVLRAGSHKRMSSNKYLEAFANEVGGVLSGRTRYIQSGLGDLLVWNMRATHAGLGHCLRSGPRFPVSERFAPYVPVWAMAPLYEKERIGIFLAYGLRGPHLDRYLEFLRSQPAAVERWKRSTPTPELIRKAESKGLTVLSQD